MIKIESERGRDKVKSKRYTTLIAQMHSPPCFPKQETHSSCQWLIPFGDTHKRTAHTLCIEHQRKSEMCCICCCITSNLFDNKETVFLLPMGINLILFLSLRLSSLVHLHSAFSILCPLSLFVDCFSSSMEFFIVCFFFYRFVCPKVNTTTVSCTNLLFSLQ